VTQRIYKLLRQSEWRDAQRSKLFAGSPDDRRDGFVHLSAAHQVRGTYAKYFAGVAEPMLIGFDTESFGPELKWEASRNGDKFPHLYGILDLSRAVVIAAIHRAPDGTPIFPAEIP
jgi:uncharacterized protein (DUF952 family)